MEALALLKSAIALLLAIQALGPLATEDLKLQANEFANAAIASAVYQITHPSMEETPETTPTSSHNGGNASTPAPEENVAPAAPQGPASIEIVAINASQELGDTFAVEKDGVQTMISTAFLGAIVRDADGNVMKDVTLDIEAGEQSKTLVGTGNFWGPPHNVAYYPFNYIFKEAGDHVIKFTSGGVEQSITLKAE